MIRNEERLYHVVVSFPSICAKEFLILRFKRNEAICCLIGFGIGIGCCLVYRWLKNNLFFTATTTTTSSEYTNKSKEMDNDLWHANTDDLSYQKYLNSKTDSAASFVMSQSKLRKNKFKFKHNNSKISNRSSFSQSNSNFSITTNNSNTSSCCCCCCCCSSSSSNFNKIKSTNKQHQRLHHLNHQQLSSKNSNYDFNEPLNDVYMNLTKFLNKQFCRNIRMRRPIGGAHVNKNSNKYCNNNTSTTNQNSTLVNDTFSLTSFEMPSNYNLNTSLHSSLVVNDLNTNLTNINAPNLIEPMNTNETNTKRASLSKRVSMNQSLDKYLDLKYETGPCISSTASSSSLLSHAINYSSKLNSESKTNRTDLSDQIRDSFDKSSLSSYYDNTNQSYAHNNNSDDISFELFANSSHRSSLFDFDELSESKYANQRSDNLVDQSLDEALNQINKLKEDMNNLCEDIDSLYNTKNTMRLNYLNEEDEFGSIEIKSDDEEENNFYFKCDCVYSNCSACAANSKNIKPLLEKKKKCLETNKFKITHNNKAVLGSILLKKKKYICSLSHKKSIRKFCL